MPSLKYSELASDLKAGIRPVYLVHGDEPFLIEDALGRLLDAAQVTSSTEFNEEIFRARESMAEDVVISCQTLPMMAERRIVVVKELNAWKASERFLLTLRIPHPAPA
jgi:DNA polymerase-3 subunit delta